MKPEEIEGLANRLLVWLRLMRSQGKFTPQNPAKAADIIQAARASNIPMTDINVRACIHFLRERGEPIGTYFYAWYPGELEETEADLTSRAYSILRARSGLRKWKRNYHAEKEGKQLELHPIVALLETELEAERVG